MHYINGKWIEGEGEEFSSHNPATEDVVWRGREATEGEVEEAVTAARNAFSLWKNLSIEERIEQLNGFASRLNQTKESFATVISKENGKPLWESRQEVDSMIHKVAISIESYRAICSETIRLLHTARLTVRHKPHGVVAVFGPFNFPGHLPTGHIIPALLAGNTVIFKGSELTPTVSEEMAQLWESLPQGVFNVLQGGRTTGHCIASHRDIDGLFFTGSYPVGQSIHEAMGHYPEKILALEMGGNNPLIVSEIEDYEAAAYLTIQSAFLTTGQRCTSARRLILPEGKEGDEWLKVLVEMTASIQVGPYDHVPEPFMGPIINAASRDKMLNAQSTLANQGGISLLEMKILHEHSLFMSPGIMDVTHIPHRKDEELFGPFLQVIRVPSFEAATEEANRTGYGLSASLISCNKQKYDQFYQNIKAGVINWNTPTTGASSYAPFGGVGKSGNNRPSGSWAAYYCSYPVASLISEIPQLPHQPPPGISCLIVD